MLPYTTDTFTPAFSQTLPSCEAHQQHNSRTGSQQKAPSHAQQLALHMTVLAAADLQTPLNTQVTEQQVHTKYLLERQVAG
jgi:hypothetical protein